ncbi:MAG: hypothetical protein ABI443_06865 [Chthoniobacterales bacterium]
MLLAHDHRELDITLADVLSALADGEVERVYNNLDVFWARLAMHIRAENIHLFPALLRVSKIPERSSGIPMLETVQTAIAQLRSDHGFFMSEIAATLKKLRTLRRDESHVYHWACTLLDEPEQKALNESIQRELDKLPPRLRKLENARRS